MREFARALTPLVRLVINAGIGAAEFSTATRLAFIRAANEMSQSKGMVNISAIAVMTGMTRRDVRRLLAMELEAGEVLTYSFTHQRTARVLSGWKTDPMFLDEEGRPAVLPLLGTGATFRALSLRYAGDVPTATVLSELVRIGAVVRTANNEARLRRQTTRVRGYNPEAMADIASRVRDIANTMVGNIEKPDRATFTGFHELSQLPPDMAALFLTAFSERAALLLEGVERWSATQQRQRKGTDTPVTDQRRVGLGIYLVDEPAGGEKPLPEMRPYKGKRKYVKSV
jgi:hypothetical protein